MLIQGDADKQIWVDFQQRVDKAPEQVLRCGFKNTPKLWFFCFSHKINRMSNTFSFLDTDIAGALELNPFGQWQVDESLNLKFLIANLVVVLVVLNFR